MGVFSTARLESSTEPLGALELAAWEDCLQSSRAVLLQRRQEALQKFCFADEKALLGRFPPPGGSLNRHTSAGQCFRMLFQVAFSKCHLLQMDMECIVGLTECST